MPYQIDGVDIDPQSIEHEWPDYGTPLGGDGLGAPFYAKFQSLILRCSITLSRQDWFQHLDSATHTFRVPAPGSVDDFTNYAGGYVWSIKEGVVLRTSGIRGVELTIKGIQV